MLFPARLIFLFAGLTLILFQSSAGNPSDRKTEGFPSAATAEVKPFYRHRSDGRPGREVVLHFTGSELAGKGTISVSGCGTDETLSFDLREPSDTLPVLLPSGAGVDSPCRVQLTLSQGKQKLVCVTDVPAKRQWTVYIYPHSHVDIGYTNTQENVELIHKRNLLYGIDLARKTKDYPSDARYLWNPEVLWPVERYLSKASPAEKEMIRDAVSKGYLHLDAGYIHTNTSAAADEELFEFFRECRRMEDFTGTKIKTLVQVDIPGMSWGVVPVAASLGIKYCLAMNNGSDRVGLSTDLSFRPFWWESQDRKSRILFLQPGSYNPGAICKGFDFWPLMAGQTDTAKLLKLVKTDNPRHNFIDKYIDAKLPELENSDYYPYDIFAMTWAMADNTPVDADLPDAVRSWNEEFAFPHLVIAGATEIMSAFDRKYGAQLPVLRGDFTEYWTDGLGTAARQTGMNRNSKERLIQAETLWSLLNRNSSTPREVFSEAWRNVIMGTEHTWCYMDPSKQPITNNILAVKFGFFQKGSDLSRELVTKALSSISDTSSKVIAVFNTLQWDRSGLIILPVSGSAGIKSVVDEKGSPVISQRLSGGELAFMASSVPGFGSRRFTLLKKAERSKSSKLVASGMMLDNGLVRVSIDEKTGDISSLVAGNQEFAAQGSSTHLNSFRYLHGEDTPDMASGTANPSVSITENGPLLATLRVENSAEGCNSLVREITLVTGIPSVAINDIVDKLPVKEKEGIHFGFGFNIDKPVTHAGIPWGVIEIDRDQLSAANRNWIAFQRWLDISGGGKGITFCSPDAPVFESGTITANILGAATNSPRWLRKLEPSAEIWSWALNNHWHTNFPLSQEGIIPFRYILTPHNTDYDRARSVRVGLENSQPLIWTSVTGTYAASEPLVGIDNNRVIITILRNETDGKITTARLWSVSDRDESVSFTWPAGRPQALYFDTPAEGRTRLDTCGKVMVPPGGFTTVEIEW